MSAALKKDNINVRITPDDLDLIRRGADACGKSLSAFVVEAASYSAQKALLDQRFMHVPADVFDAFNEAVSQPAKVHPELQKLFRTPVKWATSKQ